MHPVKDKDAKHRAYGNITGPKTHGVLKVENKLNIVGECVENTGFNKQDKFVIELFADAIALLLRDSTDYFGKPYTSSQMFGKPILSFFYSNNNKNKIEIIPNGDRLFNLLNTFAKAMLKNESECRILAEYSSEVIKIVSEIAGLFGNKHRNLATSLLIKLRSYEMILNKIPAYRHHFVHQFNVFLLGLVIIAKNDKIQEHFIKINKNENIFEEWFLASMFHDVGLPIEKLHDAFKVFVKGSLHLEKDVRFPFTPFSILSIEEYYQYYSDIKKGLNTIFDSNVLKSAKSVVHNFAHPIIDDETSHNHSFVSACMLAKFLDFHKIKLSKDSRSRILSAILFHEGRVPKVLFDRLEKQDKEKAQQAISLKENPLMFLLALCDTIQNWGRPEGGGEIARSKLDKEIEITLSDLDVNKNHISISLKYSDVPNDWKLICKKIIEPQSRLWRNNVKDLEIRINFINKNEEDIVDGYGEVKFPYKSD